MQKCKQVFKRLLLLLVPLYFLLMIPGASKTVVEKPVAPPFAWNQDAMWQQLETSFIAARQQSAEVNDSVAGILFAQQNKWYDTAAKAETGPADPVWDKLLSNYFQLAALVAAAPGQRDSFISAYNRIRNLVKLQSQHWNMNDQPARNTMYRLLYGMRAAAEEVLLQTTVISFAPAMMVNAMPSATPAASIFGIEVHSGDMLVSRGGAEVSALISRGNNYPGNFSHVALLYVDEKTKVPYLVEAHIEKGVAVSSAEQYIKDQKLRFMVVRLRDDLPQVKADPLLPHKAAGAAYTAALSRHIPYDFKMDFYDSSALFCSEVASLAYRQSGVQLWQAASAISSQGVVNWLSDFGVEHFVTQMPSDLEYDPQLAVVAEWRDPATLMKDHIDNAVMDALLETADQGRQIGYNSWMLPVVRVVKGWCMLKNALGGVGIIPEGMNATRALKNQSFVAMYKKTKMETVSMVSNFVKEKGYNPPYWQLVAMAKKAAKNN